MFIKCLLRVMLYKSLPLPSTTEFYKSCSLCHLILTEADEKDKQVNSLTHGDMKCLFKIMKTGSDVVTDKPRLSQGHSVLCAPLLSISSLLMTILN